REAAFLCLEQPLGGMSSATVFFLADLGAVLEAFGNRGYRAANLEAGLIGGRALLAPPPLAFGAPRGTFSDRATGASSRPAARRGQGRSLRHGGRALGQGHSAVSGTNADHAELMSAVSPFEGTARRDEDDRDVRRRARAPRRGRRRRTGRRGCADRGRRSPRG